ncbi:MAG: autotransporter domain-containing protein [Yersinia sp. (in: enterobacteria)]
MKIKLLSILRALLACTFLPVAALAASSIYTESGLFGVSDSWMNAEFNRQWGLGAINAHYAYSQGYNGHGVNIGVLDAKNFPHPEFSGKLTIISHYLPYDFETDDGSGEITFVSHGAHVAGIAAANRDGTGIHGVAFGATLTTGVIPSKDSQLEYMTQSNVRVINNSWGDNIRIEKDSGGNRLFFPNGYPQYVQVTPGDIIDYFIPLKARIDAFSQLPIPDVTAANDLEISGYGGMLRAARYGKLIIFAAGNFNNYNVPTSDETIPYLFPDILGNYLIVTNLTPDNDLNANSTSCGHTASYCVSAPGRDIYSTFGHFTSHTGGAITETALNKGELTVTPGYGNKTGTSMAAPHVTGAAAVLMQRFPYMTAEQISAVLKTTATDLGEPGIDPRFGWGKIDLKQAIDGPKMLIAPEDIPADFYVAGSYTQTQFVVNIPGTNALLDPGTPLERMCSAPACAWDVWRNDIAGHGGLTKEGRGRLVLTGNNTYSGPTRINQGTLTVNGALTSDVSVQDGGILGGNGSIGSLVTHGGGTVAPGNSISPLNVAKNITFDAGSRYAVEVTADGRSDQIQSAGKALLYGGEVAVTLENRGNLLNKNEVRSLLGQQYNILTAAQGVEGGFSTVQPNYLFLGTRLNYLPNRVMLSIGRNTTPFAEVAITANERAVAAAAENLALGNPVYESVLMSDNIELARDAFRQLSGQVHADALAAQINDSRYLRETLNRRLYQAQEESGRSKVKADDNGSWVQLVGVWGRAVGDTNATGYQTSTYGFMLGVDGAVHNNNRLGIGTGYTRTALHGAYGASVNSDNFPLALYGAGSLGPLDLRTGVANTWHRISTSRKIAYGGMFDQEQANYNTLTQQLFAEIGYCADIMQGFNLEPFVNLAYVHTQRNGFTEKGGSAALQGNKQQNDTPLSTVGLRVKTQWQAGQTASASLRGELGWQHQYASLARDAGLTLNEAAAFTVSSVPGSRDGVLIKVGVDVKLNDRAALSLDYGGQLSARNQDSSVSASFRWTF